ncbi:MAG: DUF3147 family protein [Candidatus Acidiferrales bacterium]
MHIRFDIRAGVKTKWYEVLARFIFGGAITVIAGLLAKYYGPVFGGLFLAFPAIFPATASLIETHEKQRKAHKGLSGKERGRFAAALCARGTKLGSLALVCFAIAVWKLAPLLNFAATLFIALAVWVAIAFFAWRLQKKHICSRI